MTKKNQAKKDQLEQFKEKAKELGADESGAEFERALEKIVRPPKSLPKADVVPPNIEGLKPNGNN